MAVPPAGPSSGDAPSRPAPRPVAEDNDRELERARREAEEQRRREEARRRDGVDISA